MDNTLSYTIVYKLISTDFFFRPSFSFGLSNFNFTQFAIATSFDDHLVLVPRQYQKYHHLRHRLIRLVLSWNTRRVHGWCWWHHNVTHETRNIKPRTLHFVFTITRRFVNLVVILVLCFVPQTSCFEPIQGSV